MPAQFSCDADTLKRGLGEFSASAMLLCLGCIGCIGQNYFDSSNLQMGLNFGLVVLACIQCFHCISGAHINPCITIAAMIVEEVDWSIGLMYILCQFVGAFFGFGLALLITEAGNYHTNKYFCTTEPNLKVPDGAALGFEFVLTATWVFAMCAVWDRRNAYKRDSLSIRIGLTVSCLTISGAFFTGASMNPARTFAPAVMKNYYRKIWIYFVGPPLAAVVIAMAWRILYASPVIHPRGSRASRSSVQNL